MPDDFLTLFNFEVHLVLSGLGGDEGLIRDPRGAFSEVSGLEISLEHNEIREGGYNWGVRQLVGKTSHQPLVFKRGLTIDGAFWTWIHRCTSGSFPLPYIGGLILVFPASSDRLTAIPATWSFVNGIVTKVSTADLNAGPATSVPIEELHIAHEGLLRVAA